MIIDAKDLLLGRMATLAAKKALLGEQVIVINSEHAIVSGKKSNVLARYTAKVAKGIPLRGPYFPRRADMVVRRTIRGMLPWKRAKGREAYRRVMCYIGIPEKFKDEKAVTIKEANVSKLPSLKSIKVKELCKLLGAR